MPVIIKPQPQGNLSQTFSSAAAMYIVKMLIRRVDRMNPRGLYFGNTINTAVSISNNGILYTITLAMSLLNG